MILRNKSSAVRCKNIGWFATYNCSNIAVLPWLVTHPPDVVECCASVMGSKVEKKHQKAGTKHEIHEIYRYHEC